MNVASLLEQAARIVWRQRNLWALGVLFVALSNSGLFARAFNGWAFDYLRREPGFRLPQYFPELPPGLIPLDRVGEAFRAINTLGPAGWVGFGVASLILLIAIGVAAIVTLGAMVAAGAEREDGAVLSMSAALKTGWRRAWPMIIIASIPAIPLTLAMTLVVIASALVINASGGFAALADSALMARTLLAVIGFSVVVLCPASLATIALQLAAGLAYRACVMDGTGALDSFRRAWQVLKANFGSAALLAVLHVGIDLGAGALISLPLNLSYVFLPAIVIVWLLRGAARAFTLELWTLAWQGWTEAKGD